MKEEFRYSICEPLSPTIIEKGKIEQEDIMAILAAFPWETYLLEMDQAEENEIYSSPSLEVENKTQQQGLVISIVGTLTAYEFYIFYKRPRALPNGGIEEDYCSDLTGQTLEDAKGYLEALVQGDEAYLEVAFASFKEKRLQGISPSSTLPRPTTKLSFFQRLKQLFS